MYKIAAALVVLMLFAACHGDGIGMAWDADVNPSVSDDQAMEEITVTEYGAVSPSFVTDSITVDAGRGIERTVEVYEEFDTLVDSCTGMAELTEEDYETVKTAVIAADLANYIPPDAGTCEPIIGTQGIGVVFKTVAGDEFAFDTGPCEIENGIENIRLVLDGLADNYITDCPDGTFIVPPDDDTEGDDEEVVTDTDGDCIPDSVESATGTDPNKSDTDGDGLPDGWIAVSGLGEDVNCNGKVDVDENGNPIETDPRKTDSDGDGISDYDEMVNGPPMEIE